MPVKSEFKIEGLDELVKAFSKLPDESMKVLHETAFKGAEIITEAAREKVSVRSGNLKRSLKTLKGKYKKETGTVESYTTWGSDVKDYAAPLELGHAVRNKKKGPTLGYVNERPFLRPAADENKEKVIGIMVDAMNKAIDEMGGKK